MRRKLLLVAVVASFLVSCSGPIEYVRDEYLQDVHVGNPYAVGSGHYAGYEWAKRTGGLCAADSESFNEGCEEYHRQLNLSRK
jgi:hypothetical protein